MAVKWVVVVTRTEARVFTERFHLIDELENELGRARNREMQDDKPGLSRSRLISSGNYHSMSGEKNPHDDVAMAFAKKVGQFLDKGYKAHAFDNVLICAEPRMMGRLRTHIERPLSDHVEWRTKDLGKLEAQELRQILS